MTNFLIACGVFCCGDAAELANNIPYLLFDSLEQIRDAQQRLDRRKL
jgi:hypothetical protein